MPDGWNIFQLSCDGQHLQLRPVRDLFRLAIKKFNVFYVGVRNVNDISCDVFQKQRVDYPRPDNTTFVELLYSRKSVTYCYHSNVSVYQIPGKKVA